MRSAGTLRAYAFTSRCSGQDYLTLASTASLVRRKWILNTTATLLAAGLWLLLPDTAQAVPKTSIGSGSWSAAGTWSPSGAPATGDDVTISAGHTVVYDVFPVSTTPIVASLNVDGVLQVGNFDGNNRTVAVSGNLTITAAGSLAPSLTSANHVLFIGGNLTNDGIFDGFPGATRTIVVSFFGNANQTVSGTGPTTRFDQITVNNIGVPGNNIVDLSPTNFIASPKFLTLNAGILKISGTYTLSDALFAGEPTYRINADEGIWLNNPNATVTAQIGSIQLDGSIRITNGIYNIGTNSGDSLRYNEKAASFTMEGGACNIAGRFEPQSLVDLISFNMSGGTLTVNTVGNSLANAPSFGIGTALSSFIMSGGTIVIQGENTNAAPLDYLNVAANPLIITGGTVQFGNSLTPPGAVFEVSAIPGEIFPSLSIDAASAPTVRLQSAVLVRGNVTIAAGATLDANNQNVVVSGNTSVAGDWINDGSFIAGTGTVTLNSSAGQSIGGISATSFNGLTINNGAGVTLSTNATVTSTLTLTSGNVDAAANSTTLSIGQAGTVSRTSGHIIGNLQKTYVGIGTKDFEVGTANGFSKVTVNITAGAFPAAFTVSATQAPQPAIVDPTRALQRYWTLATPASVTATLTFNYIDPTDIPVTATESLFQIVKVSPGGAGGTPSFPGGTVNTGTNTATISGVSSFSDWTLSEPFAPTEVNLVSFNATRYEDGVLLKWQTGHEVRNLGFNLHREQGGNRIRVTPSLVAGSALLVGSTTRLTAGQSYSWFDPSGSAPSTVSAGDDSQYYLEDIDLNGRITLHGPFTATEGRGMSPSAQSVLLSKLKSDTGPVPQRQVLPPPVNLKPSSVMRLPRVEDGSNQWNIASKPAAKLRVNQPGWFRINQPDLAAAGIDVSRDPRLLQMFVDGAEIPIIVNGEQDGLFDAADSVEFYGTAVDTPFTDRRVYWLQVGSSPGLRIHSTSGSGTPHTAVSFPFTVERKDRSTFFSALKNGDADNWFGPVIASEPVTQTLNVQHLNASDGVSSLEVALQGVTDAPGDSDDHKIVVLLNGVKIGTVSFNGRTHRVSRFTVPKGLLVEGDNVITFESLGGSLDISLLDYVRLTYPHDYTSADNSLSFTASGNRTVTVGGFSSSAVRVVDVTDPAAPTELKVTVTPRGAEFAATFSSPGSGERSLFAFASTRVTQPAGGVLMNHPSSWNKPDSGADLVIISYREFISTLTPLRDLRRSQGYLVSVIDVEDLYDEFGYGHHTPQAIKDFLAHVNGVWKRIPRFVLLAGDGSNDPRNYTGLGEWNLVPAKQVETTFLETASDDWFVDFNLDGSPEMAIGRLPVRTLQEANAVVSKIVAYDKSGSPEGAVVIADRNDGFDFEAAAASLKRQFPPGTSVVELLRSQIDDVTLRAAIIDAMNRGPKIVNYIGHGSSGMWRGNIFSAADAAELTNRDGLSFALMMTCLNGMFQEASGDSLAEALLKSEHGGAVAVWASSALTRPDAQAAINHEVIRQAFSLDKGGRLTIGEATMKAKAATSDGDVRRSWILFGDPTTRLR